MPDGFRAYADMELSDDAKLDMVMPLTVPDYPEPPEYPPGLKFSVREADFAKLGIDPAAGKHPRPGERVPFTLTGVVTSAAHRIDGCRIELEVARLGLGGGKPVAIGEPGTDDANSFYPAACLCLCTEQCERLDLDAECEVGDQIDLVGAARVEGWEDTQWGGKCLELQIVEMAVEGDE